jgi:hypothetical protein
MKYQTFRGGSFNNFKLRQQRTVWMKFRNGWDRNFAMYYRLEKAYRNYMVIFWANFTRLNNLLIILNISIFFLSGLVLKGYFYTFYSIGCFSAVAIITILPVNYISRLWFYLLNLLIEIIGIYFLVASVVYWVRAGAQLGV